MLILNHLAINHTCKILSSSNELKWCPLHQLTHTFSPSYHAHPSRRSSPLIATASNRHSSSLDLTVLGLQPEMMPKHVAIIMDGSRRWARNRMLPVGLGHIAGKDNIKQLAIYCSKLGIQVLSVFALSTENWTRPKVEFDFLKNVFKEALRSELEEMIMGNDVQVTVIGDKLGISRSLQSIISYAEESSRENKGMRLVFAINYSGTYNITEASKNIAVKVKDGELKMEDIDETIFKKHLLTSRLEYPDPELLIRTSGEIRLSNFMLCQLAYSELVFVDKLCPDFKERDLVETLKEFQRR